MRLAVPTVALLLLACEPPSLPDFGDVGDLGDDGVPGDEDPPGESESSGDEGPGDGVWADIRCFYVGENIACVGRPAASSDAWVFVVSDCDIAAAIDSGAMSTTDSWTEETCAPGSRPSNFMPESACYWVANAASSACYSGGDGWYTQVVPACDVQVGVEVAWPDWQCDGESGSIGQHPWDAVTCSATEGSACAMFDDGDAMLAWPTCWVDSWSPAPVPVCNFD